MSSADEQFVWGYDDSEKVFEMTLREYIQEMLLKRFGNEVFYEEITYNEQAFIFAGVINTIHENYPDSNSVEYHSPPVDGDNHTFQSIRFIFQERDNVWYLIGIARDVPTG